MNTNLSQTIENISILECVGPVADTTNVRKVAVVGRLSTAIKSAKALALSNGRVHIVEVETRTADGRPVSIQREWVRPTATNKAATTEPAATPAVKALASLKSRKPQMENGKPYLIYTGSYADCVTASKVVPGARARKNGEKGSGILVVPIPSIANYQQPIAA